jgi:6-pyruvoyl-tetrahydropterin synthase
MQFGPANINIDGDGTNTASLHLKSETNGSKVLIKAPTNSNFSTSVWYLTLPGGPGSNGQVLTTDGNGNTSWTTVSGGGGSGITAVVDDTTPELGGALDLNGNFLWSNASGLGATYGDVAIQPIATTYSSVHGGLKIHCRDHTSGASHYEYYFNGPNLSTPGSITATGNVTAYSDIKLKKEIKPIKNALDKVCKINGVTFERSDLETQSRFAGVIAQEVEQVLPEVVSTDENGYKSVAYGNLVGLLVEAIKEQQTQIDGLRKAIEER